MPDNFLIQPKRLVPGFLAKLISWLTTPQVSIKQLQATINLSEGNNGAVAIAARLKQSLEGQASILMFTGIDENDSVADLVCGIAQTMCEMVDDKLLLIDFNVNNPSVHETFKLTNDVGLHDILTKHMPFENAVQNTALDSLLVLTCGRKTENTISLLGSDNCRELFHFPRQRYRVVLISAPPIISSPEAAIVASRSDAVVLVTTQGRHSLSSITASKSLIQNLNKKMLGLVLVYNPKKTNA
jgi:capsular exopolysaccharide synthesis family protein